VEGAEIIGWVSAREGYVAQYFGSDGPNKEVAGVLTWTMRSAADRFSGTFSTDGNTITGRWERLEDDESWQHWMDVTLTREAG
jgi:hypothetical protein